MEKLIFSKGLQSSYNGIDSKNPETIYICTDTGNMYLGSTALYEKGSFINAQLSGKKIQFTKKDSSTLEVDLSSFATSEELATAISTLVASVTATSNGGIEIGGTATNPTIGIKLNGDTLQLGSDGLSVNSSKFDAAGSANTVKTELIGSDSDNSSSNTIYGAKKYADEKITAQIASTYKYKGSCTYAELPADDNQVGDVWNVTDAHENVPAGTNYAWNGSEWDALAGVVDLTPYALKTEVTSSLAGKVDKTTTINTKPLSDNITLNGADIALSGYQKGSDSSEIAPTDTINSAIGKLENRISATEAGGVTSISSADNSLNFSNTTGAITANVKLSVTGENMLTLEENGLRVKPMEWETF